MAQRNEGGDPARLEGLKAGVRAIARIRDHFEGRPAQRRVRAIDQRQ